MVTFIDKSSLIADRKFSEWLEDGMGLFKYALEKSYEVPMEVASDESSTLFQYKKNGEWMLECRPKDERFSDFATIRPLLSK